MKPVTDCALDAFIPGLPDEMLTFVDTRNPRPLDEAYEYALHVEERQRYTEKARVASVSTYHVARQDQSPNGLDHLAHILGKWETLAGQQD